MSDSIAGALRPFRALILEDDDAVARMLASVIKCERGEAVVCHTVQAAREVIERDHFELLMLDHKLPDGTGAEFFHFAREKGVLTTAIMLTGLPDLAVALELTRNGLFDYLTKPFSIPEVTARIRRAVERSYEMHAGAETSEFIGNSAAMREVKRLIGQAAENPRATILLTGETGSGKDLTARTIHELAFGTKSHLHPFVTLNAANLPGEMFEAELFGAEKGAYTGAHQQRHGLVEAAQGGTLFLDEIAEVPFAFQAKLLGFLESREYRRLGSTELFRFDGRIIAATNQTLESEVHAGRFRADLWYRLDVFAIHIPPLRERLEDIPSLAEFSLNSLATRHNRPRPLIRAEDMAVLRAYPFPGNVRELRNVLERSLLQTPADAAWLQLDSAWIRKTRQLHKTEPIAPRGRSELNRLEEQEYALIRDAMLAENGAIRRAAGRVGLSHQALLRRLEKWPELRLREQRQPPPF